MARAKDSMQELVVFSGSMDRWLSSLLRQENGTNHAYWRPPTDVYETDENVVILVEIAGMEPDQFQVEFTDKILRVTGKRRDKHLRAACHCLEVQYGDFASEVYLPGEYDVDAINAEYNDGFLTITLPKRAPETKTISVNHTADDRTAKPKNNS
jgi:HSP20 family molecular chaperone IbpA